MEECDTAVFFTEVSEPLSSSKQNAKQRRFGSLRHLWESSEVAAEAAEAEANDACRGASSVLADLSNGRVSITEAVAAAAAARATVDKAAAASAAARSQRAAAWHRFSDVDKATACTSKGYRGHDDSTTGVCPMKGRREDSWSMPRQAHRFRLERPFDKPDKSGTRLMQGWRIDRRWQANLPALAVHKLEAFSNPMESPGAVLPVPGVVTVAQAMLCLC